MERGDWVALDKEWSEVVPSGKLIYRMARCSHCGFEKRVTKASFVAWKYTRCKCKYKKVPDIGDKVNRWTVLGVEVRNGYKYAVTVCECGNDGLVHMDDLISDRSKGCIDCGHNAARKTREELERSCLERVMKAYVNNSSAKGREFDIPEDVFFRMIKSNCFYSGHPPMSISRPYPGSPISVLYNGIDRIDNSDGYTVDNTVTCCQVCNRGKRAMPYDQWIDWVKGFRQWQ